MRKSFDLESIFFSMSTIVLCYFPCRCAVRHDMMKSVIEFIEKTQLPVYIAPMAKGAIDESHPQFRGIFAGNCSTEEVQKEVYAADLIFSIGSMNSDFNTGGFTYRLLQTKTIGRLSFVLMTLNIK